MKGSAVIGPLFVLPLPRFVLHPFTALVVAAVHVYLASGHLWSLFGGDVQWTHIWKGFGALAGAYVFAALASRSLSRRSDTENIHAGAGGHECRPERAPRDARAA